MPNSRIYAGVYLTHQDKYYSVCGAHSKTPILVIHKVCDQLYKFLFQSFTRTEALKTVMFDSASVATADAAVTLVSTLQWPSEDSIRPPMS